MAQIKDLQKLIEERAEKKLEQDLKDLSKLLKNQPLLGHDPILGDPPVLGIKSESTGEKFKPVNPRSLLSFTAYISFKNESDYIGQLYRFWLPVYIARESAEFLQTVDRLNKDLEDLQDEVTNLMNNQQRE